MKIIKHIGKNIWKDIKYIYNKTLLSKFNWMCYWIYEYNKDLAYISDTLYSKGFKQILEQYLNTTIHKDWLGRLYGIVNPNINKKGEYDFNKTIIEIDGENTNNNDFVQTWTYKQLILVSELFKLHKLFDYVNLEFKHVGPINQDNYLIIFDIISRKEMSRYFKSFSLRLLFYIIIAIIAFFVKIYIF